MFIFIEGIKLPVNPEEIKLEDKQGIETVAIIDTGNVPLVGNPELQSIEFESFIPSGRYDGNYQRNSRVSPESFVSSIRKFKTEGTPIQLMIGGAFGSAINGKFLVEQFDVSTKTGYENDLIYKIKFLQYRSHKPRKVTIKDKQALEATKKKPQAKATEERSATTEKPAQKSHTVVSGDTLWGIAQTFYGDGSRYTEIYEANKGKIKDPHWIYPGQEFVIP